MFVASVFVASVFVASVPCVHGPDWCEIWSNVAYPLDPTGHAVPHTSRDMRV